MHGSPRVPAPANAVPRDRRAGQNGSPDDNWSRRALVGLLFAPMPWIMWLFTFVHLGGIRVRGRRHFPAQGPVILVANHPATWVDVLVLYVALGRRLHFLADEHLYRPRVRAWLLGVFGALPVTTVGDAATREARNAETFRRCRALLECGEAVAIFPEGVSATDRSLRRFHSGAARIARDSIDRGRPVPVVPVGIHYADRVEFRTGVVVSVGEFVRLPLVRASSDQEKAAWIAAATVRLEQSVAELILELPEPSLRTVVEELAPLAAGPVSGPGSLDRARQLTRRMVALQHDHPDEFARIARHARRHRRIRTALGLVPYDAEPRSTPWRLALTTAAGAIPAGLGLLLHALPAFITQRVARRFDPTRVALMRIGTGWLSFTLWYGAMTTVAVMALRGWTALAVPFAVALLGAYALAWSDGWRQLRVRLRWVTARRRHPGRMWRLRHEEEILLRLVREAESPRVRAPEEMVR